ncbi:MAG: AfsR/SARP family transcriptional regulator, partial [Thermoleophilia bacterium]|nr:AfsR/SARP family transcriptional regulator [Thermoleophilia bacterium]
MLRARLLGPLAVEVDGRPLPPLPGLRPRSLLAYLLLAPGPHPRTHLAGAFWPDVLETSARASLRSALWSVRAALDAVGGGAYLAADRASAGIDAALPREVDVEEFARLEASDAPA